MFNFVVEKLWFGTGKAWAKVSISLPNCWVYSQPAFNSVEFSHSLGGIIHDGFTLPKKGFAPLLRQAFSTKSTKPIKTIKIFNNIFFNTVGRTV